MSKNLFEKLNEYLANQQVMYIKLHNLHWYVKGRSFFTLHAKLEELYDQTAQIMDEVAERLLALGGSPVASLKKRPWPSLPSRNWRMFLFPQMKPLTA